MSESVCSNRMNRVGLSPDISFLILESQSCSVKMFCLEVFLTTPVRTWVQLPLVLTRACYVNGTLTGSCLSFRAGLSQRLRDHLIHFPTSVSKGTRASVVKATCQRLYRQLVAGSELTKRFKSQGYHCFAASHKDARRLGRDHQVFEVGHICSNCDKV